jgi:polyhydroxyalkanoate synthesis regulator phasin
MVAQIAAQPPVGQLYASRLVADGFLTEDEAKALFEETRQELRAAHDRLKESIAVLAR